MQDDEADVQQGDEDGARPQRPLVLLSDGADALLGIEHAKGRARAPPGGFAAGAGASGETAFSAGAVSPASSMANSAISTI